MPNFLIIGAAKAGTTALYHKLQQHPQVYMSPIKEPNFFALEGHDLNFAEGTTTPNYLRDCVTDIETYTLQFDGVTEEIAIGEASPIYLFDPQAPSRIQRYVPDAKLIVILRDPVERAYSNFLHHIREGLETVSDFNTALQAETQRQQARWWWGFSYVEASSYHQQIQRYLNHFNRDQIQIYLYEDLKYQPESLIRSVFEFLGVDPTFVPVDGQQYNATGIPKSRLWWSFLSQPHPIKEPFKRLVPKSLRTRLVTDLKQQMLAKPALAPETREHLVQIFREDILQLQAVLQRDLSVWLEA